MNRRSFALFALMALVGVVLITRLIAAPGYTDVYYHLNAANRFASGQGLTDPYVWTYIGALDHLPMPSHLYWMPLTSFVAGISMILFNAPGNYAVAQLPFLLMFWATTCMGYWLGWRIGRSARHAWVAGLLTLFNGFYTKFWGEIDTFAPYALFGSLALVMMGIGIVDLVGAKTSTPPPTPPRIQGRARTRHLVIVWFAAGALSALGHLTRADGMLLVIVGVMMIVSVGVWRNWVQRAASLPSGDESGRHAGLPLRQIGITLVALVAGYLLVMLPYFGRNLQAIGSPLPLGGTQAIWFREYNDIFNFPPNSTPQTLLANGIGGLIASRRVAVINNLATFVAVEGLIVMTPLMLIGLWQRRRNPLLFPFALYALGMHLAMTFVFPFPGYRGGLLHSAAALIPFWAALGVVGLDEVIEWIAKRRRRWNVRSAKLVLSSGLVLLAVGLSAYIGFNGRVTPQTPALYTELRSTVPADARILSDDPPELYYYTGMGGATLPNGTQDTVLAVARRYQIDYLLLKDDPGSIPAGLLPILDTPPAFLKPLPFKSKSARLYAIQR